MSDQPLCDASSSVAHLIISMDRCRVPLRRHMGLRGAVPSSLTLFHLVQQGAVVTNVPAHLSPRQRLQLIEATFAVPYKVSRILAFWYNRKEQIGAIAEIIDHTVKVRLVDFLR